MSPVSINFGNVIETSSFISILLHLSRRDIRSWFEELTNLMTHAKSLRAYLKYRTETPDTIRKLFKRKKKKNATRYNGDVSRVTHHIGNFVLLFQKSTIKLESRWRDSFKISRYGSIREIFFKIVQLNDRGIRDIFHENHLNKIVSRIGFLTGSGAIYDFLSFQTIRKGKFKAVKWKSFFISVWIFCDLSVSGLVKALLVSSFPHFSSWPLFLSFKSYIQNSLRLGFCWHGSCWQRSFSECRVAGLAMKMKRWIAGKLINEIYRIILARMAI